MAACADDALLAELRTRQGLRTEALEAAQHRGREPRQQLSSTVTVVYRLH